MFCLHSHHPRRSSTASQPCQTDWQNSRGPPTTITYKQRSCPISLSYHTRTMHFSRLVIIAALTASMSVSACVEKGGICNDEGDCCYGLWCDEVKLALQSDRLANNLTRTSRQ
ncbi:hypothetical protein K503DRAFT_776726 [Rhizopogon vinicolor AM-OR11-026]|uniref:Uncharacterized protein n=1 Tax=Rhizopogon vinicolor AM-OR11-026 TaxID=1314800 RepID=A0A1B7MIF3_9AGAM|nr:hypothetical protein K503DRAFT_776726 [Rhizopogon vinicolor AM-OR11-026]